MATQRYTICKIGGAAAEPVLEKFSRWHARNLLVQESESMQWEPSELASIKQFVELLRAHAAELPVIYFSEHIDMWSMGDSFFPMLQAAPNSYVVSAHYEMACIKLNSQIDLTKLFSEPVKCNEPDQDQEDMWFLAHLWHAIRAWEKLIPSGAVVVIREVLGTSAADQEVVAKTSEVPDWLK